MADRLNRTLSFFDLTVYGVGIIVGAGIYAVIGAAAAEAKQALWLSFLLAALVALVTAASYAELASMYSNAGAEYEFLRRAFPSVGILAFMAGGLMTINSAATVATVSLAFGGYLAGYAALPIWLSAFALVAATTALNIAGIRESTWASIALIGIEVGALVLFAGAGAFDADFGVSLFKLPEAGGWAGLFAGAALIFFAYIGFEDVANLSEETKRPERTVPRALLVSVVVTGILYLAVALAALAAAPPDKLAGSQAPLKDAAGALSPWLGNTVAVAALFATASTALITLISASRMLYGMARGGDMPRMLGSTLPGRRTPWVAALLVAAVSCALLPLGEVKVAASVSSISILAIFVCIQAAVIGLRFTAPRARRAFRMPLNVAGVPVIPVLGIVLCLGLLTQFEPLAYAISGALIAAVAAVYWLGILPRSSGKSPKRKPGRSG